MFDLSGKVAIITGGSTGIGEATARLLAQYGCDTVLTSRTHADLERVAESIRADTGRRCVPIVSDVRNEESVDSMGKQAIAEFGHVNILINNAGGSRLGPLESLPTRAWDSNFELNARGPFLCTKAIGPHMLERGSGVIVNVSSTAGVDGVLGGAHYAAAKAAVQMFTRVVAGEWGSRGIRCNCVAVGIVASERAVVAWQSMGIDPDVVAAKVPARRVGTPAEIAYPILFLASEAASYVNGQTLLVDGGPKL